MIFLAPSAQKRPLKSHKVCREFETLCRELDFQMLMQGNFRSYAGKRKGLIDSAMQKVGPIVGADVIRGVPREAKGSIMEA